MKEAIDMTGQPEAFVKFENVVKRFGNFVAVEKADFEIGRGEFLAIMGSSGCGKTTTLRMLAGLEDPTEGAIYLDGEKVNGKATWDRDTPMVWQSREPGPVVRHLAKRRFRKLRRIPVDGSK